MISAPTKTRSLSLGKCGGNEGENRTKWDFELRRELNMFADLNYAIRVHIIQEPLKMEHENRWERLDKHLMVCLAGARRTELHRLQVRDACESIFNSVHRIVLLELLCQSPGHMHGVE